jgi:hypothetical protein
MSKALEISKILTEALYKDYDSDGAAVSISDLITQLKSNGITEVSFEEMVNAQKEANTVFGKEIIVYNHRPPFYKSFELKGGYNKSDLKNLYAKVDEKLFLSKWQITQNIFFSMMSDRSEVTYYDTNKGVVVAYMDQYLVPLSQDNMEGFKISMERAARNEPADRIDPNVHKQIPILKTSDFIKTIEEVITSKQEFNKLRQAFEKTVQSFQLNNSNFLSTNVSSNSFQRFLDSLTQEVTKNNLGDQNTINLLYKETADTIANKFVSAK